ncbi:MAG TPA: hypothetical protein VEJ00_13095 [Candidatus Acidoferrales bacterium]|nr:hypothetical protein [Candidatus Acidoferrales bacterium]
MSRIAIVAALEREIRPLVKGWRVSEKQHSGRNFRFYEQQGVVLVCGGIGAEAARRAAEAVIVLFQPALVCSVGFAGALDPALNVGEIVRPHRVVNATDGSSVTLEGGEGVLVSFSSVASPAQKAKLRESFAAQAVDMEAAAVARAAEARGVAFVAIKAISDDPDFVFPALERFVDSDGQFQEARFAWFAVIRPWLWPGLIRLARNGNRASRALCDRLQTMVAETLAREPASEVVERR